MQHTFWHPYWQPTFIDVFFWTIVVLNMHQDLFNICSIMFYHLVMTSVLFWCAREAGWEQLKATVSTSWSGRLAPSRGGTWFYGEGVNVEVAAQATEHHAFLDKHRSTFSSLITPRCTTECQQRSSLLSSGHQSVQLLIHCYHIIISFNKMAALVCFTVVAGALSPQKSLWRSVGSHIICGIIIILLYIMLKGALMTFHHLPFCASRMYYIHQ